MHAKHFAVTRDQLSIAKMDFALGTFTRSELASAGGPALNFQLRRHAAEARSGLDSERFEVTPSPERP